MVDGIWFLAHLGNLSSRLCALNSILFTGIGAATSDTVSVSLCDHMGLLRTFESGLFLSCRNCDGLIHHLPGRAGGHEDYGFISFLRGFGGILGLCCSKYFKISVSSLLIKAVKSFDQNCLECVTHLGRNDILGT